MVDLSVDRRALTGVHTLMATDVIRKQVEGTGTARSHRHWLSSCFGAQHNDHVSHITTQAYGDGSRGRSLEDVRVQPGIAGGRHTPHPSHTQAGALEASHVHFTPSVNGRAGGVQAPHAVVARPNVVNNIPWDTIPCLFKSKTKSWGDLPTATHR